MARSSIKPNVAASALAERPLLMSVSTTKSPSVPFLASLDRGVIPGLTAAVAGVPCQDAAGGR
jgi:hypothetical protein